MVRAHEIGVIHGALRPVCVFLDATHRPKVYGFGVKDLPLGLEASESEAATMQGDVRSFSLLVYAIVAGKPNATAKEAVGNLKQILSPPKGKTGRTGRLAILPEFLARLIIAGLSGDPDRRPSMDDFLNEFEDRDFAILAGADAAAVSAFAAWADEVDSDD
jgi:hypothetical protein